MSASIGALRTRIRLEKPVVVAGDGGVVWVSAGNVWAAWDFAGVPPTDIRFEVRQRDDVQPGWRVALNALRFRIHAVRGVNDRRARLLLVCEEERA